NASLVINLENLNGVRIRKPLITGERSGDPSDLDLELVSEPLFIPDEDGVAELDTRIAGSLDRLISQGHDARRAVAQIVREQIVRTTELNPPVVDLEITSPVFGDRVLIPVVRDRRVVVNLQATADAKGWFGVCTKTKPQRVVEVVPDFQSDKPVNLDLGFNIRVVAGVLFPRLGTVVVHLHDIPMLAVLVPRA